MKVGLIHETISIYVYIFYILYFAFRIGCAGAWCASGCFQSMCERRGNRGKWKRIKSEVRSRVRNARRATGECTWHKNVIVLTLWCFGRRGTFYYDCCRQRPAPSPCGFLFLWCEHKNRICIHIQIKAPRKFQFNLSSTRVTIKNKKYFTLC